MAKPRSIVKIEVFVTGPEFRSVFEFEQKCPHPVRKMCLKPCVFEEKASFQTKLAGHGGPFRAFEAKRLRLPEPRAEQIWPYAGANSLANLRLSTTKFPVRVKTHERIAGISRQNV